jgi:hypothetical protein
MYLVTAQDSTTVFYSHRFHKLKDAQHAMVACIREYTIVAKGNEDRTLLTVSIIELPKDHDKKEDN